MERNEVVAFEPVRHVIRPRSRCSVYARAVGQKNDDRDDAYCVGEKNILSREILLHAYARPGYDDGRFKTAASEIPAGTNEQNRRPERVV